MLLSFFTGHNVYINTLIINHLENHDKYGSIRSASSTQLHDVTIGVKLLLLLILLLFTLYSLFFMHSQ